MKDEQFDRAMRFALQGYPARGAMPWTPFSTELESQASSQAGRYRSACTACSGHIRSVNIAASAPMESTW
jgi:hypothetical protein